MDISVVIPTFNRPMLLRRCLDALLIQTVENGSYEIIVVDDAGRDETRRLVGEYASRADGTQVRYLAVTGNHGPAAARNCGWKAAQGGIIAFTDDDCVPEPDWLARGKDAFVDGVVGVSGRIVVPVGTEPTDYELNCSFLENSEFATANCFYLKRILEDVGGFDERFSRAWREDADLFFTLLRRRERLLLVPDAIVVHPVRTGHWGISIREQSKSIFNALLYKKHPDLYRAKITNKVLSHYYVIVGSAFSCLFALGFGFRQLGAFLLTLWLGSTASLCLKRLQGTSHSIVHVVEMIVTSVVIPFLSLYWRVAGAFKFNVFFY